MVYLPMAYLFGKKFVGTITPTILELRDELYCVPYSERLIGKKLVILVPRFVFTKICLLLPRTIVITFSKTVYTNYLIVKSESHLCISDGVA
jgi:hypothetical protein